MKLRSAKRIIIFLLSIFIISCGSESNSNTIDTGNEDNINDFSKREYVSYVPPTYNSNKKTPLIFAFHGSNGTGNRIRSYTNFDFYANRDTAIMVYPNSFNGIWAEGCGCTISDSKGVDDIGYIDYLINKFSKNYNIDTTKIFAIGVSQGGLFLNHLACKRASKFAGFASVISTLSTPASQECFPNSPVNMIMINGSLDNQFLWDGFVGGANSLQSIPATFDFWANISNCNDEIKIDSLADKGIKNFDVEKWSKTDCSSNKKVILYKVNYGEHTWYDNAEINSAEVIMDFFKEIKN